MEKSGRPLSKDEIGRLGEKIAAKYLFAQGAKILYKNYRASGGGEIDVVIRHGDILGFVEVKTRTSDLFGRPADAVNLGKQMLIARGVRRWLQLLHYPEIPWRCDIVEVDLRPGKKPQVNWIQSAFQVTDIGNRRSRKWAKTA